MRIIEVRPYRSIEVLERAEGNVERESSEMRSHAGWR
jgi:hypothetical protein